MERTNHSSSTTWRRQLRREPFLGRGGCAICSGALAHWGRGDAPPPALACKSPPHSTQCIHSWPRPIYCLAPAPSTLVLTPQKTGKSTAFGPSRSAREPTVKTRALCPCPCLRSPTRNTGSTHGLRGSASSSENDSFLRSA